MINLEKKKRGRPPKKVSPQVPPEVSAEVAAIAEKVEAVAVPEDGKEYVFKSKFIKDRITLIKPQKTRYEDGSTFVDPGIFAEFDRNTWLTKNPVHAKILRDKIEGRKNIDPLHIVETTQYE